MTGTVEHMSLGEARKSQHTDQSRLSAFGSDGDRETTYIGIVRSDSDDFQSAVDEMRPELAPPSDLFHQWLNTKRTFEDDMADVRAHNEALEHVSYRSRFGEHLETNADARQTLEALTERVLAGEHIVLVCYCGEGKWCHREPVAETLKSMVAQRIDDE